MGVESYDVTEAKILENGGKVAMPKYALWMAWQGYYIDTEGNVFGIHQPDKMPNSICSMLERGKLLLNVWELVQYKEVALLNE